MAAAASAADGARVVWFSASPSASATAQWSSARARAEFFALEESWIFPTACRLVPLEHTVSSVLASFPCTYNKLGRVL